MLYEDEQGSRQEFLRLLAEQGEEPAFVTRRRRLDAELEQLRWTCQTQRRELLHGPRLHLRKLASILRGHWKGLSHYLAQSDDWRTFQSLHETWNQDSPPPPWSDQSGWWESPARPLRDLHRSVERFNRSWNSYLAKFDLHPINQRISDYNEFYVLEKACAFGREDIARRGFEPFQPMTIQSLLVEFPEIVLPAAR